MTFGQMFHHQKIGQMMPDQTIFGHMTFGLMILHKYSTPTLGQMMPYQTFLVI